MNHINDQLKAMHQRGKAIRTAIAGAGQMGKALVSQLVRLNGMEPSLMVNRHIDRAKEAFRIAKVDADSLVITNNAAKADAAIRRGKYVLSENMELIRDCGTIDVVVDATGNTDAGAVIAMNAISSMKHIVMLNVETDVTIGCILKHEAEKEGVVYTGSAGDEPAAVKELYDFACLVGLETLVIGKGKNNKIDLCCTPDSVREEALARGMSPKMLSSFKDGTKTMVELACMSNATGFLPDVRGAHGPKVTLNDICEILELKDKGGILNSYKAVEYVDGLAPGVFLIVTSDIDQIHAEMQYLKIGRGPNYCLFRPYHLCSIETPISVAKAYLYKEASIVSMRGIPFSEAVTIAKKDLFPGEMIDGIGGFCVYGAVETHTAAKAAEMVPIGLINSETKVVKAVKKGTPLTYKDIILDSGSPVLKLRKRQDELSSKYL